MICICREYLHIYKDWLDKDFVHKKICRVIGSCECGRRYLRVPGEGPGSGIDPRHLQALPYRMTIILHDLDERNRSSGHAPAHSNCLEDWFVFTQFFQPGNGTWEWTCSVERLVGVTLH